MAILAAVSFQIAVMLAPRAWALAPAEFAVFGGLIVVLMVLYLGWLPRILKRRMAAEMREDPEGAARRRARERRMKILGWMLGLLGGTAGLLYGLWSAGAL